MKIITKYVILESTQNFNVIQAATTNLTGKNMKIIEFQIKFYLYL